MKQPTPAHVLAALIYCTCVYTVPVYFIRYDILIPQNLRALAALAQIFPKTCQRSPLVMTLSTIGMTFLLL